MKVVPITLHMLDRLAVDLSGFRADNIPAWGWLWTVRRAVGISARGVAEAAQISTRAVAAFERREALGTIQIGKLASLGDILGCQLLYVVNSFRPDVISTCQRDECAQGWSRKGFRGRDSAASISRKVGYAARWLVETNAPDAGLLACGSGGQTWHPPGTPRRCPKL